MATPLADSDEICFGCKVPENELKYKFVLRDDRALLERSAESFTGTCVSHQQSKPDEADSESCVDSEGTPPLIKMNRAVPKKKPPARKKLKLDSSRSTTTVTPPASPGPSFTSSTGPFQPPITSSQSSEVFTPQVVQPDNTVTASEAQIPTLSSQWTSETTTQDAPCQGTPALTSTAGPDLHDSSVSKLDKRLLKVPITAKSTPSVPLAASGVSPSPALSTFSTKSTDKEVEDLFDEIVSDSDDRLLDEVIFGGSSTPTNPQQVSTAIPMDGATIQVLAVQDQMQQERQKLLSSIEALKSELAAKNELITKQEKRNTDAGGVVSSMREEFTCVICQELFICAHTLSCSHSFCGSCIKEWMKTHKDCPICRKRSTTQPIRSLALDNAITTVESKLSAEEKKERDTVKEERSVLMGVKPPSTKPSVIVISSPTFNPSASRSSSETIIVSDNETSSSDSDSDSEDYGGYGGYGRCYHCGKCLHVTVSSTKFSF